MIRTIQRQFAKVGKPVPLELQGKPAGKRAPRGMNGYEREYASILENERRAGTVLWYAFEPIRIKIGTGAYYKPDFMVLYRPQNASEMLFRWQRLFQFHEIKGTHFREAAKVRIKVAASLYPFLFVVAKKDAGKWSFEEIPGSEE